MDFSKEIGKLEILLDQIQNDPTLMMIVAMTVVITLVITLIVVVFSSTINTLKRNLSNAQHFNQEKIVEVKKLTREIKIYDKTKIDQERELKKYEELKKYVKEREEEIRNLKTKNKILTLEKKKAEKSFTDIFDKYERSLSEIRAVKKRNEELIDGRRKK